jgi:hypothetical protein
VKAPAPPKPEIKTPAPAAQPEKGHQPEKGKPTPAP